jgi:uncharacterized protein (TIGR00251 family)
MELMYVKMWSEALSEGSDGTYVDLDVTSGSGSQSVKGYDEWRKRIKVNVKAEARDGRANSELITFLGKFLKVPPRRISIASGQTTNNKRVLLEGMDKDAVIDRFGEVLGPV